MQFIGTLLKPETWTPQGAFAGFQIALYISVVGLSALLISVMPNRRTVFVEATVLGYETQFGLVRARLRYFHPVMAAKCEPSIVVGKAKYGPFTATSYKISTTPTSCHDIKYW